MKKTSNTVTASKAASTKVAAKKTSTNSNASSKKKKEQEIIFPEPRIDFVTLFEAFKIYSKFTLLLGEFEYIDAIKINNVFMVLIEYYENQKPFYSCESLIHECVNSDYEEMFNDMIDDVLRYQGEGYLDDSEALQMVHQFQEAKYWIVKLFYIVESYPQNFGIVSLNNEKLI